MRDCVRPAECNYQKLTTASSKGRGRYRRRMRLQRQHHSFFVFGKQYQAFTGRW